MSGKIEYSKEYARKSVPTSFKDNMNYEPGGEEK